MTKIQSDISIASQRANAIATSLSALSITTVTKDEQTTVSGNDTAKTLITSQESLAGNLQSQLSLMIANIHSLASEFEVTDAGLSQTIKGLQK